MCDLQGGIYDVGVVLTDPVILSRTRQYGVTDLGAEGISTFFGTHRCNGFCRVEWSAPRDRGIYFKPTSGTSMIRTGTPKHDVTTRYSAPHMTHYEEEEEEDDYYYGDDDY